MSNIDFLGNTDVWKGLRKIRNAFGMYKIKGIEKQFFFLVFLKTMLEEEIEDISDLSCLALTFAE